MAKTILVVEDELRELFEVSLAMLGNYKVESAETGPEAVRKAQILKPDIIIMDMRLPKMPGDEAIRHIRKFNKTVPILAVTGFTDKYSREALLAAGADDYLAKPFNVDILLEKIATLLRRADGETLGTR